MTKQDQQQCIDLCIECANTCQEILFKHCLQEGGAHVEQSHVTLMADCIQICNTAADFMVRGSSQHEAICRACAEICEACGVSCEKIGGDEMSRCAEICYKCGESCHEMSNVLAPA